MVIMMKAKKKVKKLSTPKVDNGKMIRQKSVDDEAEVAVADADADADADAVVEEQNEEESKEIRIIAQEVQIVRSLVSNDVNKRNRQLKKLKKWLKLRSSSSFPFKFVDFCRIWKGLYYMMWMSDKPLVQEDLAEQLGQLLQCFEGNVQMSVLFFGAFLRTMQKEWFGIDQWRIDKFLMLVRRMLRYMFRALKEAKWNKESIECFNEQLRETVLAQDCPAIGLTMHVLDIFLEELAKVSNGDISAEEVGEFVRPFVVYLGTQRDGKLASHTRLRVFCHLLYQSALGREYSEKYNAWKEMGFPTASIHDIEKEEIPVESTVEEDKEREADQETQEEESHLDPRAGNVDVLMPELPLDASYIIEELNTLITKRECPTKRLKMLRRQLELFKKYQNGRFPLGVQTMPRYKSKSEKPLMKDKIEQLENLENELYGVGRKLKQLNKRKRRKLLKSVNFENVNESNLDEAIMKVLPKEYLKERMKRAQKQMMNGWVEEEIKGDSEEKTKTAPSTGKKKKNVKEVQQEPEKELKTPVENNLKKSEKHKLVNNEDEPAKKVKKPSSKSKETGGAEKLTETKKATQNDKEPIITEIPKNAEKSTATKTSEWDEPLAEGEVEYFIPSRKLQLKKANSDLVPNPLALKADKLSSTPTNSKHSKHTHTATPNTSKTPNSIKRVKIALKHNTVQNPSEYIKQIKSSPNVPYDAEKKPGKGVLKPNLMPSPINPFYKKKIGLP